MSIITQGYENNQECESRISKFFSSYKIGDLLRKCGAALNNPAFGKDSKGM